MAEPGGNEPSGNEPGGNEPSGEPIKSEFNFRDHIPAEFADEACLADFQDLDGLVKSYVHAQKRLGDTLVKPADDASAEEKAAFWQKLGAPSEVKGYQDALSAAGLELDASFFNPLAAKALSEGVPAGTFTNLINEVATLMAEQQAADSKTAEDVALELRERWGGAYDKNLGLAQMVLKNFGGEEALKALESRNVGNDPAVIGMFAQIGAAMVSGGLIDGTPVNVASTEEAKTRAQEIMRSEVYLNQRGPEHDAAVAEVQRLMQQAYPNAAARSELSW